MVKALMGVQQPGEVNEVAVIAKSKYFIPILMIIANNVIESQTGQNGSERLQPPLHRPANHFDLYLKLTPMRAQMANL